MDCVAELERILYVDDDPNLRELVDVAFEVHNTVSVTLCESGSQALQLAPTVAPQIIVLDVNMPDMDGPATLAALRKRGVSVPAVFITADTQPEVLQRLRKLDVEDIIVKPFDPLSLGERLYRIWRAAAR